MAFNRIRSLTAKSRLTMTDEPAKKSAASPTAALIPPGFALCPPQVATANAWQQEVYRLAYERAKAAAEIPHYHRRLFSTWN